MFGKKKNAPAKAAPQTKAQSAPKNPSSPGGGRKPLVIGVAALAVILVLALGWFFIARALFSSPNSDWIAQSGSRSGDFAHDMALDQAGNAFVVGSTEGSIDANVNYGYRDILLVKYDIAGRKLWSQQLGTNLWEEGYGVAADAKGNAFVAGYIYGGFTGVQAFGQYDALAAKYNSSGEAQWVTQIGSPADDYAYAAAADSSGNVVIAGYTDGAIEGAASKGGSDYFIAKYNPDGGLLWSAQGGSPRDEMAYSAATDGEGNIYITGSTSGSIDGNPLSGGWDIFVAKYSKDGKKLWIKQFGSASDDTAASVSADAKGNVHIAGFTSGAIDGRNQGGYDYFAAKLDSNGTQLWVKQCGTPNSDFAYGLNVGPNGNVYIAGYTEGIIKNEKGQEDLFITALDADGGKLWVKQIGSANGDYAFGVASDSEGGVVAAGQTWGKIGDSPNAGDLDIFVLRLKPAPTGLALYFPFLG